MFHPVLSLLSVPVIFCEFNMLHLCCVFFCSKQVTCLSISMDGTKLVSGSHDCTVKIFDVFSGQCVRTLNHKGEVSS